jgi:hypothetical protein
VQNDDGDAPQRQQNDGGDGNNGDAPQRQQNDGNDGGDGGCRQYSADAIRVQSRDDHPDEILTNH